MKNTYSSLTRLMAATLLAAALGCASEAWNFDRYRDERATDIDTRLSSDEPIVKNPFSQNGFVK
jgi:hypothetical protein